VTPHLPVLIAVMTLLQAGAATPAAEELALTVSAAARSLRPGEVVLLTVKSGRPLDKVQGSAFGRAVPFYPTDNPAVWRALVGIDLDTAPGAYPVAVEAWAGQTEGATTRPLRIARRTYRTRNLTVPEAFVKPPESARERIERERERIQAVFSAPSPQRLWSGRFARPAPGAVVSGFGTRSVLNGTPAAPHAGTDFRAPEGAPIRAPSAGRVVLADDLYFSGGTVIIDHGLGLYSILGHLSRISVHESDRVARGDLLGAAGSTGRATGPHLHWSVRLTDARVDPLSLVAVLARTSQQSGAGSPR